jgi:TDG/mug DNA glycosylase family protein
MLDDLLRRGLKLVVVGTAAGAASAKKQQYYSGPGNKFWRTIHAIGLTPRILAPAEARQLLAYGIGLTDLVKGQSGADTAIRFGPCAPDRLRDLILDCGPEVVCFNGKRAALEYLSSKEAAYGEQRVGIGNSRLFVAPSTSGAASGSWDISYWHTLATLVHRFERSPHPMPVPAPSPNCDSMQVPSSFQRT